MTKLKHTPGPWSTAEIDDYTILLRSKWSEENKPGSSDGYGSCLGIHISEFKHQNDNPCVSKKTAMANAILCAAAPEMLEVLIEFCEVNCTECNIACGTHCSLYDSKNIIERATGLKIEEILNERK